MSEDIEGILEIDEFALHKEWMKQASLYHEYASQAADAKLELNQAKAEKELASAELELDIRNHNLKYNVDKVTENTVKSAVVVQPRYQDSLKTQIRAQHKLDLLEALVTSLEHKKKGLEFLVQLHLSSYYAEPRAPKGMAKEVDDMETEAIFSKKKKRPIEEEVSEERVRKVIKEDLDKVPDKVKKRRRQDE